jgi:peptidoglycan hydrolase-like protein with peptidoglycan-binding domain
MKGHGVTMLQSALIDIGFKMPKSTIKNKGYPDGKYGNETKSVVEKFQVKYSLSKDGVAGHHTILKLDSLMVAKYKKSLKPTAPLVPLPPVDRNYTIGTSNPIIKTDPGAGPFNTTKTETSMWALKQAILEILPPRGYSALVFIGPDAVKHMYHYLQAKGTSLTIRLENMIKEVPSAKKRFENEVNQAKKFVESLPIGSHSITSKKPDSAYNAKIENKNWYFAVGGYSTWGKGTAVVTKAAGGTLEYTLNFEYHFYDRYNWDKGKSVTISGIKITDEFMGEFHRQGLAKEYDEVGVIKRQFRWKQGQTIPSDQYQALKGR